MTWLRCGRPTKAGRPCRNAPVATDQGCASHLTDDEEAAYRARRAEPSPFDNWALPPEPACWAWPIPTPGAGDPLLVLTLWQDDRCAVCGHQDSRLVLDHDHQTALVRGWLCRSCNSSEPHRGGVFDLYRDRPPAGMLGVEVVYVSAVTGPARPAAPPDTDADRWQANPLVGVGL